ncbi:MAG: carboxypeptidase-like regulatory domain-containing protein [Chitinophagales bacterium]|nr:carboxypeptidase-like regulatory domain-containing protein [Chitinophagales bacterium]
MKKLYLLLACLTCCFFLPLLNAQNNVLVNVQVLPPYSPYLSTYVDQPNKLVVTLQNLTTQTQNIKLWVRIAGDNGVSGTTTQGFKPASPIVLNAGQFKQIDFSSNETRSYFDANNVTLTGITKAQLIQNQALPEGNYTICVRALDYNTGAPVSLDQPSGCSAPFSLFYIDPPVAIQPVCNSEVTSSTPQNVLFMWTPPATAPGGIQYEFTLKEMPASMPNPFDVIKNSAFPVLYSTTLTSTTTLVYTNALPQLTAGKKYVWRVKVKDPQNKVQFKNQGFSDVCVFTYKAASTGGSTVNPALSPQATAAFTPLPSFTIKGKLQWSFRKVEEDGSPVSSIVTVSGSSIGEMTTVANVVTGTDYMFPGMGGSSAGANTAKGASGATAGGAGASANVGSGSFFYQGTFSNATPTVIDVYKPPSPFEVKQNKIDALAGSKKFPLKATKVKVMLYVKPAIVDMFKKSGFGGGVGIGGGSYNTPNLSPVEIGTATTNAEGEFSITCYKDIEASFYDLYLTVQTEDFIFADAEVPFSKIKDGVYTIGTLNGLAKTFRLQLKCTEMLYDNQKGYHVKGGTVKDVKIKITHDPTDWSYYLHPNLTKEGTRIADGLDINLSNKTVANAKDDQQIGKIFPNHYTGGCLVLDASREGYHTVKVCLNINEKSKPELFNNYLDKEVPLYVYECNFYGSDPIVKGKVLVEGTNAPVKGASVELKRQTYTAFATTNDKGEFEMKDIPVSDKPYTLTVKSGNITTYTKELNLNKKALVVDEVIYVQAKMITITGTVKDEDKNKLQGAVVVWKTGGTPTITTAEGKFVLSNIKGKHWLIAKKPGFKDTEVEVEVKEPPLGGGVYSISDLNNIGLDGAGANSGSLNFLNTLYGSPSNTGNTSSNFNSSNFNNISNASVQGSNSFYASQGIMQQLGGAGSFTDIVTVPVDIGDIILKRFYLKLTVQNAADNTAIAGAKVEFNGAEAGTTNASGVAVLSNVAPSADYGLVVYGPAGSNYVPVANNVVIDAAKDTVEMTVKLSSGLKVSGKVLAAGAGVKDALVYVEGKDYIKTKTDENGNYSFAVAAGNKTLWAVKSGFVGDSKTQDFTSGDYTVDFTLKDAGFDASKLLGFDIMLTESKDLGNNEFEITGSFVNIPSNILFKASPGLKIPFTKQKVKKVTGGVAPSSGEIQTDVSQLPLSLWDYLKLHLENPSGVKVKPQGADNTKGKIEGLMVVDVNSTFTNLSGLKIPLSSMKLQQGAGTVIPAFTSDGSAPFADTKLKLGSTTAKWTVHDLTLALDFNNTFISKDGIDVAGNLTCDGFKYLSGLSMKIEQMRITTTGDIKNLKVSVSPQPKINISAWEMAMSNINIGSQGIKLGGNVKVSFSGSNINLGFTDLNVSKNALSGGSFALSGDGVDLFGLLKIQKGASQGLTLMIMPNGKDFKLGGNVNFNFNQYLSKAVKIDEFSVATDGNFSAKMNSNVNVEIFGFAGLDISTLGINTASKQIDLGGKLKFNVPGFGAGVGTTMRYKPGSVSIDDLNVNMSIGGIGNFAAKAVFNSSQKKFSGDGSIKIVNSPLDFKAGFFYSAGSFGANFNMGAAVQLFIGPLSLDKIGGGFAYDKPASKFSVYGECRVKFAPDPYGALSLDPTKFGITISGGGPIFSASATGKIVEIPFANASFVMNIPARTATLDVVASASFNKIPGLSASGNFVINAELGFGSSPYIFMGQAMNLSVPFLCNSSGGVAVAVNYNVSASKAAMYHLPVGKFTGLSAWSTSSIGITKDNAKKVNVGIGHIKYWLGNQSEVSFFAQLNGFNAGFKVASGWSAGAEGCLDYVGCIGAEAGASGELSGSLSSGGVESASATLAGWAKASAGCCGGGCATKVCWKCCVLGVCPCPCGAKACFEKSVSVKYVKGSGFSFDIL